VQAESSMPCSWSLWKNFFVILGFWTQGLCLEPLSQAFYCDGFFQDRELWAICLGWLGTMILLISASWVAGITGGWEFLSWIGIWILLNACLPLLTWFFFILMCVLIWLYIVVVNDGLFWNVEPALLTCNKFLLVVLFINC
jgi:hypothetical protein